MKNKIKALIIDDERLARKNLNSLLSKYNEIEIVGEAEDVDEAIIKIKDHSPEILFLDIQMPRQNGFDLLSKIDYAGKIIFITAFDEYAIRAFNVNALDYLLKPISPDRLEKTIQRLLSQSDDVKIIDGELRYDDRLFVSVINSFRFISLSEVIIIEAMGNYSKLIMKRSPKGVILRSMKEWEHKLPDNHFTRIHRSYIININYIEKIEKSENSTLKLFMKGIEDPLVVSRRYRKKIKKEY
ncbi:MAG: response regulator [Bacteroidales bacterium]|nr:response regulator [Bacteroidales bacterium]